MLSLRTLLVSILVTIPVSSEDDVAYSITLDKPTDNGMNGTGWVVSRVILSKTGDSDSAKTVCRTDIADGTMDTICSLSGYKAYESLAPDNTLSWTSSMDIGYSMKCSKYDNLKDCTIKEVTTCTDILIVNCSLSLDTLLVGPTTNKLLMPVILIPICILYVIVLCYLDAEDTRKTKAAQAHTLAKAGANAFQKNMQNAMAKKSDGEV